MWLMSILDAIQNFLTNHPKWGGFLIIVFLCMISTFIFQVVLGLVILGIIWTCFYFFWRVVFENISRF